MFWQLNRAVWGFAALLPEINCLPTTLASPGFAGQTEKSGVWAYNPNALAEKQRQQEKERQRIAEQKRQKPDKGWSFSR